VLAGSNRWRPFCSERCSSIDRVESKEPVDPSAPDAPPDPRDTLAS
jgi:endogenous inhibitor of DNA gyrase (YacG/DUF329 family)